MKKMRFHFKGCFKNSRLLVSAVAISGFCCTTFYPGQAHARDAWADVEYYAPQTKLEVSGQVVNDLGQALPGVTVTEKGTANSAVSNESGNFTITVASQNASLVFTSVGYSSIELPVTSSGAMGTVTLSSQVNSLDEVVVVGYGTQRRREVTSSISTVKSEDFNMGGVRSPMELIQGKVAGLNITRTQGNNPNAGTSIQLRGVTSLSGTNNPLIVVDGIPGGNLDLLQQDDIESIDVLKDGSAAAIYGTRANGGVIIVTTKKGKAGDPQFDFSTYVQREFVDKKPDFLSAADFRKLISDGVINQSQDFGASTDLFDELINEQNLSQYYNLAASGGTNKANYRGSVYYNNAEGIAHENSRQQFGGRINYNQTGLNDILTMNVNLAANFNNANLLGGGGGDFEQAVQRNPTAPLYNPDGTYLETQAYNNYNPLSRLAFRESDRNQQTMSGDVRLSAKLAPGLTASVFGSYLRDTWNDRFFRSSRDWEQRPATSYRGMSYASKSNYLYWSRTLESTLNYTLQLADRHNVSALGGYSYQYETAESYSMNNNGFTSDAYADWNMGAGVAINNTQLPRPGMGSNKQDNILIAFFGRLNYSFDNKYFLQLILRREGSSRFGANNKWGNFPAASIGWSISDEDFMSNVGVVNNLKLRAGYGVTGNQGIPNYQSLIVLSTGGVYPQVAPGQNYDPATTQFYQTFGVARNPNPFLRWEKKAEWNIGLDYGLWNNRLNGSIDVYNRTTTDLLYNYTVPQPPYVQSSLFTNVGSITSTGVEVLINAVPVRNADFTWDLTFAGNTQNNKLSQLSSDLYRANFLEFGGLPSPGNLGNAIRIWEGSHIGDFFGKRFAGFDHDGRWQFYKADGSVSNAGGMANEDRVVIGNGVPKMFASLSNTFTYRNFDLTVFLRGKFRYDILNTKDLYFGNKKWLPNNLLRSAITTHDKLNDDPQYSDYYLEPGGFVKLDNLTLGYNFNPIGNYVKRLYLYVTGRNLLTFTKYSGIDPELEDTGFTPGIDNRGFYPRTKSWAVGLRASF